MANPAPGTRFRVRQVVDWMDGDRLLARYRPDMGDYKVTSLNARFVAELVDAGQARLTGGGGPPRPGGVVTVREDG